MEILQYTSDIRVPLTRFYSRLDLRIRQKSH